MIVNQKFLDTPLAELEEYGVLVRTIGRLESGIGAVYVGDLRGIGAERLEQIRGLGPKELGKLRNGLLQLLKKSFDQEELT